MAIDLHVLGRVRKDHLCALLAHQEFKIRVLKRAAAEKTVFAELPDILSAGDCRTGSNREGAWGP
jgi:hypothetical protein